MAPDDLTELPEPEFWAIVGDPREPEHARRIVDRLEAAGAAVAWAWDLRLARLTDALYRWDMLAVATIVNVGMSDDRFEYFCCWVVSQGREAYELALSDPAEFALSLDPDQAPGERSAEEVMAAASDALERLGESPVWSGVPHAADASFNFPVLVGERVDDPFAAFPLVATRFKPTWDRAAERRARRLASSDGASHDRGRGTPEVSD